MIKRLLIAWGAALLLLVVPGTSNQAQARDSERAATCALELSITELRNDDGHVALALFDSAETFPNQKKALIGKVAQIRGGRAKVVLTGLKPGTYAVAVLHDENKNDKMDFNFLGMPLEGFGFSNDAKVVLGPPSFKAAAFRLVGEKSKLKIRTRYFSL